MCVCIWSLESGWSARTEAALALFLLRASLLLSPEKNAAGDSATLDPAVTPKNDLGGGRVGIYL